jgi:hypothetical protein
MVGVPSGFTALTSTSSLLLLLGFLIQTTPLPYTNGVWHDEGMDGGGLWHSGQGLT